jgi:hypothetical protein
MIPNHELKPRTPMPVARSDIQLIFSIRIPAVQTQFLLISKDEMDMGINSTTSARFKGEESSRG